MKHAFLILAHKDDLCFRSLIMLLDDDRNDIFIHMDKKNQDYNSAEISRLCYHASVYHTERTSVTWGGHSMIRAEIMLLELATSISSYAYYHLLSGQDLPIKRQDVIHAFFDSNTGKEFVRFNFKTFQFEDRVRYYHCFQEKIGRKRGLFFYINRLFLLLQKLVGIHRNRGISFQKGTNWFSITDAFARFVCGQKEWVEGVFKNTLCCDELFIQTLCINSVFKDNVYWPIGDNDDHAIMRLIDWKRGQPYVWRMTDEDELKSTDMLFCRKFDPSIDSQIIEYVKDHLCANPDSEVS